MKYDNSISKLINWYQILFINYYKPHSEKRGNSYLILNLESTYYVLANVLLFYCYIFSNYIYSLS